MRTAPMGPSNGMPESISAADAPLIASTSCGFSRSAPRTVTTTCVSLRSELARLERQRLGRAADGCGYGNGVRHCQSLLATPDGAAGRAAGRPVPSCQAPERAGDLATGSWRSGRRRLQLSSTVLLVEHRVAG